jgi:heme exporter protein D
MTGVMEFLQMGGYAGYVWSAFGLTAVVLVYNVIRPIQWHRRQLREIEGQIKRDEARQSS